MNIPLIFADDDDICSHVAKYPQNYLVPHPTDCTKYYSCQKLGWGTNKKWIAYLMPCPQTTGFDPGLSICKPMKTLSRCSGGNTFLHIIYAYL